MEKEAVKNKPIGEDTSNEDEADRKSDRSDMATGTGENKEAHVDGGSERSLSSRMSALKNAVNVVGKTAMVIRAMGKEDCHVDHESPDPSLLQLWYKLDRNARPPVYALQKVRYVYAHRFQKLQLFIVFYDYILHSQSRIYVSIVLGLIF